MSEEAFERGFIKAAADVGYAPDKAYKLMKQALGQSPVNSVPSSVMAPKNTLRPAAPKGVTANPVDPSAFSNTPSVNSTPSSVAMPGVRVPDSKDIVSSLPESIKPYGSLATKFNDMSNQSYFSKIVNPANQTLSMTPQEQQMFNNISSSLPEDVRDFATDSFKDSIYSSPQVHAETAALGSLAADKAIKSIPALSKAAPIVSRLSPVLRGLGKGNLMLNLGLGGLNEATEAKPGYFDEHMSRQNADNLLNYGNSVLQNSARPLGSIVNTVRTSGDLLNLTDGIVSSEAKNMSDGVKLYLKRLLNRE